MPLICGKPKNPMEGNVNKTLMNLTLAVILGVTAAEWLQKKTPLGKMLGI